MNDTCYRIYLHDRFKPLELGVSSRWNQQFHTLEPTVSSIGTNSFRYWNQQFQRVKPMGRMKPMGIVSLQRVTDKAE